MTFIDPALVLQGARIVARQATEVAVSTALSSTFNPSPTPDLSSSSIEPTQALGTQLTLTTSDPPTSTAGEASSSSQNTPPAGGNNSSPLLFFVALGFGVVFTNLWIIVGVKYCFRYNARNRQMRMNEDGEPINMETMPRPHRRRREKKLMTIDEVNEKFPMLKYKTWVASRAQEGLPTRGGVSSPSRPNSVRDVEGVVSELPNKERMSTEERPTTIATAPAAETTAKNESSPVPESTTAFAQIEKPGRHASKESTSSSIGGVQPRTSTDRDRNGGDDAGRDVDAATLHKASTQGAHDDDDDEEDDEHINAAIPPECLGTSGDTCAICIDTLEDDDDVRGLTCGHAFHAVCLDPWLTSRRACCPLCKADYYTPKPRPPGAENGGDGTTVIAINLVDSRSNRMNMPNRPRRSFFGLLSSDSRSDREMYVNNRHRRDNRTRSSRPRDSRRGDRHRVPTNSTPPVSENQAGSDGWFSRARTAISRLPRGRQQNTNNQTTPPAPGAGPPLTPSQLEAGVQRP
ncbi:putative E3 ubiquitin-protein ligase RNF167 precursor [Triangularia verruculosa]|uniref:E3 ubiquitin-protein ligase RNF167 n=1 Tax=Triangularia verruculosa TaxID=2587418 RepID=A0AAN6XA54_9PEZI|nr:putative E3 ubiquitin-protein ligase RNF167 precursor [Triangularia verruculosa]